MNYENEEDDRIIKEDTSLLENDSIEVVELTQAERYALIKYRQDKVFNDFYNVDTSLSFFADAPSYFWSRPFLYNLGTFGSAVNDLSWYPYKYRSFDLGLNQHEPIDYTYDDMKLYSAGAPFTELHWRFGSERLEHLVAEHGQVLRGRLAIGAKYQRSSSQGFYQRQRTASNNGYAYMMYQGKKQKYKARIEFIHNGYLSQQNGGTLDPITSDISIFDVSDIGRREVIPVNLMEAESYHRSSEYGFTHFYDIGDDIREFRNDTISYLRYVPKWRIQHRLSYKDEYFLYSDDGPSAYYDSLYLDPSVIRDYIHHYSWTNRFDLIYTARGVMNDSITEGPFRFSLGLESGLHWVRQIFEYKSNAQTLDLIARLEKNPFNNSNIVLAAEARLGFGPDNAGRYVLDADLGYKLNEGKTAVSASIHSRRQNQAFISQRYFSNIHQWENELVPYKKNTLGLHCKNLLNWLDADLYFHRLNDYRVWDANFSPSLINASLIQSNITATIPFGKFKLKNYLTINATNQAVLGLPPLAAHHYFYIEDKLFQGALDGQLGLDLFYNSPFKPLSYTPTIGQLYYDSSSDVERGFTPMLGAFISIKVRTVLIMGRAEFINQGLGYLEDLEIPLIGTNGYYLHPNLPAQDRLFSLAVRWQFYD